MVLLDLGDSLSSKWDLEGFETSVSHPMSRPSEEGKASYVHGDILSKPTEFQRVNGSGHSSLGLLQGTHRSMTRANALVTRLLGVQMLISFLDVTGCCLTARNRISIN